jgi:ubiquinone/menaquinone biosynthesis C-methylase UbiE
MTSSNADIVRREFGRQAPSFAATQSFFGNEDIARWIGDHLSLRPTDEVLDVCGGAGHLSRALAGGARAFTVLDLTRDLLDAGRGVAPGNVSFVEGDAAAMPFADGAFDVVVSRFAFHHLSDQPAVVREMARAARAGARIALIDMVNGGARHDELEILRDPSHTRAFTRSEAIAMLAAAGAEPVKVDLRRQALPVQRWLTQAAPPPDAHEAVFAALTAEADGGEPTGLNAHRDADGVLHIAQDWLLLVARVGG